MPSFSTLINAFTFLAVRGYAQSCNTDFDWSSLNPAPTLNWVPCYSAPLECCRFEVPLDYSKPDGAKVAIAMTRVPSTLPTNSTEYLGPLLFNPGGPGGSGVDALVQDSGTIQSRIDALAGAYDFVTFDPRGVGRSTPQVQRFPDELSSALWGETSLTAILPALSIPGNIGLTLAKGEVTNAILGQNAASYLRHINTPNTASDMLQIVQAYGQEKISYYGTSYGTTLGATFASAYPDKIERMILDGVVNAEAYYAGNYTANMLDTDAALDTFFKTCYEAGPDRCAVYDSSPSQISDNFDAFHEQLKTLPLPVFNDETRYGILDYTMARQFAREMPFNPFSSFAVYAEALALAQKGNGSALYALASTPNSFTCDCANGTNPDNGQDAQLVINCNDAVIPDRKIADWEQYYETAANVSKFSEVWVGFAMRCSAWPVPNEEKLSPKSIGAGNTSFPILFISNTIDPVTPRARDPHVKPCSSGVDHSEGFNGCDRDNITVGDAIAVAKDDGDIGVLWPQCSLQGIPVTEFRPVNISVFAGCTLVEFVNTRDNVHYVNVTYPVGEKITVYIDQQDPDTNHRLAFSGIEVSPGNASCNLSPQSSSLASSVTTTSICPVTQTSSSIASATPSTTTPPPHAQAASSSSSPPTAAIAGGSAGGATFIAVTLGLILFCWWRRRQRRRARAMEIDPAGGIEGDNEDGGGLPSYADIVSPTPLMRTTSAGGRHYDTAVEGSSSSDSPHVQAGHEKSLIRSLSSNPNSPLFSATSRASTPMLHAHNPDSSVTGGSEMSPVTGRSDFTDDV